jgi:hypothetical protein
MQHSHQQMMGGFTVQYMHQAVHLIALALFGAMKAANPKAIATSAKTSTSILIFNKDFIIRYHLLSGCFDLILPRYPLL